MPTKKDITFSKSYYVFMFFKPPILKCRPEIGNYRRGKISEAMLAVAFCIADRFQNRIASYGKGNT